MHLRTDATHPDFQKLVAMLDEELKKRDGDEHAFYAQFNQIDNIRNVVVVYLNKIPVACGAFKPFSDDTAEIKRMFVHSNYRGLGIAHHVLCELEAWVVELSYSKCVLETGKRQPEAISLYEKAGYKRIPNYGQYKEMENSVCMEKGLT